MEAGKASESMNLAVPGRVKRFSLVSRSASGHWGKSTIDEGNLLKLVMNIFGCNKKTVEGTKIVM